MDFLTILGLIAATLTSTAFLPQVLQTWKTRQTKDINLTMYSVTCVGFFLWLVYGLLIKNIPLVAANTVSLSLASTVLYLKIKNG